VRGYGVFHLTVAFTLGGIYSFKRLLERPRPDYHKCVQNKYWHIVKLVHGRRACPPGRAAANSNETNYPCIRGITSACRHNVSPYCSLK
jgi:hypothetical protein